MNRSRAGTPALLALAALLAAACTQPPAARSERVASPAPASVSVSQLLRRPGGTWTDDGPDGRPPVDLDTVRDAVPHAEPLHPEANEPYTVFGREYVPAKALTPYRRHGTASWYGRKFHGQRTTSGEVYDMYGMTAAHPTLPVPSYARITNLENRRSVIVRINDRGPFASGRIMDVSYAAAHRLGFVESGSANVEVEAIVPDRPGAAADATTPPGSAPAAVARPVAPTTLPPPTPIAAVAPAATASATPAPATQPAAAIASAVADTEAEAQMPLASDPSGIYLQLGAFSMRANAEAFRARVASRLQGIAASLALAQRDGLHRVQLGPFRDRAEANRAAREVREQLDLRPMVVVR